MKKKQKHLQLFFLCAVLKQMAAAAQTVHMGVALCGINDVNLFQGQTPAQRIATEMFADQFETMIDITETNVTTNLTLFLQMLAGGGRIRLSPGDKQALLSFIGWTRHMIRLGIDPSTIPFPIGDAAMWFRIDKTHKMFI